MADRVQEDAAKARTLITGALLAELGRRLYEYENATTWNTDCTRCAAVLDSSIRETERREKAEAKLAAIEAECRERRTAYPDPGTIMTVGRILAIIGTTKEEL